LREESAKRRDGGRRRGSGRERGSGSGSGRERGTQIMICVSDSEETRPNSAQKNCVYSILDDYNSG
jgi:hypothetical protein